MPRAIAIALLILAVPDLRAAVSCANRSKPFLTITRRSYWTPPPVSIIEISEDRTIATGPFEHGCPRCGSLSQRELQHVGKLVRDPEVQRELQPFLDSDCQSFDTPTLNLSIDGHDFGLCSYRTPPRLARVIRDIDQLTARHLGRVKGNSPANNRGCEAMHAIASRRSECRQLLPWKERETQPAARVDSSPLALSFAVEPNETLPGLPLTMRIAMTNHGSSVAGVPRMVALEITPPRGEPFLAVADDPGQAAFSTALYDGANRTLAPGETATLDWEAGRKFPYWDDDFSELRCLEPGRYRLRLIAGDSFPSNETELVVLAPRGVDAKAWALVRRRGPLWGVGPFPELWKLYPDSAYAAYGVPLDLDARQNDPRAVIELYGAALRHDLRGLFAGHYRLRMAEAHVARGLCFARRNDARAREEYDAAQALDKLSSAGQMPRTLADYYRYSVSRARYVRAQIEPHTEESPALMRCVRKIDELLAALDAVPPDESHALGLLRESLAALEEVTDARADSWKNDLRDVVRASESVIANVVTRNCDP